MSAKTIISAMRAAGCDAETILVAVEAAEDKRLERQRARTAKCRKNNRAGNVTGVTSVTGVTKKESSPHTPLKEKSPLKKNPPKGGQKENPPDAAKEVWDAWPIRGRRRSSLAKTRTAYAKLNPAHDPDAHAGIMRAVALYVASPDAKKDNGAFVPALDRWLRDERHTAWLDASTPKMISAVPETLFLSESREDRFLAECRADGATDQALRRVRERFTVEKFGDVTACVTDESHFEPTFRETLRRLGVSVYAESYAAKRRTA